MAELTHIGMDGKVKMVDIGGKKESCRTAKAEGKILINALTLEMIKDGALKKGDALATAKIAGIMAAKKTAELIPLCHNIPLDFADVTFDFFDGGITALSEIRCRGNTGAEMEALTAVTAALLTIYDMAKAADKRMTITDVMLTEKSGGSSGHFVR